jgi:hypothetical protein
MTHTATSQAQQAYYGDSGAPIRDAGGARVGAVAQADDVVSTRSSKVLGGEAALSHRHRHQAQQGQPSSPSSPSSPSPLTPGSAKEVVGSRAPQAWRPTERWREAIAEVPHTYRSSMTRCSRATHGGRHRVAMPDDGVGRAGGIIIRSIDSVRSGSGGGVSVRAGALSGWRVRQPAGGHARVDVCGCVWGCGPCCGGGMMVALTPVVLADVHLGGGVAYRSPNSTAQRAPWYMWRIGKCDGRPSIRAIR